MGGSSFRVRPPVFPLPGGEPVDPIAEALPAGGVAHPAHSPGEALPVREAAAHGSLPHLQGGLGLPLPLRGPDLPMLRIVLVSGPERMPRRVAELGNGACRAQVELDAGLDCQLALLCAVHAVLRATLSWSRITTAVPSRKAGLTKHTGPPLSQPMHDKVCPLRGGYYAHERSVENLLSVPSTPTLANTHTGKA